MLMNCFLGKKPPFFEHITCFSPIKLAVGQGKEGCVFESNKLGLHIPVEDSPKKYVVFKQLSSWSGDNMKGRQHSVMRKKK